MHLGYLSRNEAKLSFRNIHVIEISGQILKHLATYSWCLILFVQSLI